MAAVLQVICIITWLSALPVDQPAHRGEPAPEPGAPFAPSVPAALRTFWLDFHGNRLCQDIDAVFVFHGNGLEVWCLTDNLKSLDRLKRMAGPLSPSYRVDFYVTRPQPERDKGEDRGPPPGLWNNQELRAFLGDMIQEHQGSAPRTLSGDGAGLLVGVGIATGDVLVGSIGSDDRLDYTAIGPAVNLASRLCATAEPGQILMCAETFSRVSGLVAATALPPMTVKGFSAPVAVYAMSAGDTAR